MDTKNGTAGEVSTRRMECEVEHRSLEKLKKLKKLRVTIHKRHQVNCGGRGTPMPKPHTASWWGELPLSPVSDGGEL